MPAEKYITVLQGMSPGTRGPKFESRACQTGQGVINGLSPLRLIFEKPVSLRSNGAAR